MFANIDAGSGFITAATIAHLIIRCTTAIFLVPDFPNGLTVVAVPFSGLPSI
ncbi:hypothetical protein N8563_00535 [bacterium]|nr:hypothetical protein [bacterium]